MALTKQQVQKMYVAYFNRPAEPLGLANWLSDPNATEAKIAAQFAAQPEYKAVFAGMDPTAIVDQVYMNLFGRHVENLQSNLYWSLPLAQGKITIDNIVLAVANGAQGSDKVALDNKIAAATAFTDAIDTTEENAAYNLTTLPTVKTWLAGVTATLPDAAAIDAFLVNLGKVIVPGSTFTLTTSATDTPVGTANSDTFIGQLGQTTTLQASDVINGGTGNDTLRVVTDGTVAQTATGFTVANVETLEVQSQATGGTTLSMENVTGVTTIRSSSSSQNLTLQQVKAIAGLEIVGALATGGVSPNVSVSYQGAAVSGANDTQAVMLNGSSVGTLTFNNGIETLAINASTAASTIGTLAAGTASKITVAGDSTVTITNALDAAIKTIDASAQTAGGTRVVATAAQDVTVIGGAGNDRVEFTGAFTSADSFNGGAGTDTVIANVGDFTASSYAASAKLSNVEVIQFKDALGASFDASKIAGETTYTLAAGYSASVSMTKLTDGVTINIGANSTGNTLTASIGDADAGTLATTTGTVNTMSIGIGAAAGVGVDGGTVVASGVETLNISSTGDNTVTGANKLTVTDAEATKVVVTGSEDLALTLTGTALTSLDASKSSGANDFSLVTFKNVDNAATILGGSGADKINGSTLGDSITGGDGADVIAGQGGADTITGGAGADVFVYNSAADSRGTARDVITDFVSGTDKFNFSTLAQSLGRSTVQFKSGTAATFGDAQASIVAGSGNTQVVFEVDNNTLWVDLNDDGTLNNNDLAITLTGVTKLVAADVNSTATPGGTGNFITLSAPNAVLNTTTNTNANAAATAFGDTVNTTAANLVNSTIGGDAGNDTLQFTDAYAAGALSANVTSFETVTLSSAGNNTIGFNAANATKNVNGGTAVDTITTTNMVAGGLVSAGDGADVVTVTANLDKTTIDMGNGDDRLDIAGTLTMTLNGGAGTDTLKLTAAADISGSTVSNFEILDTQTFAPTLKVAQYAAFTGGATGTGVITFSDAGAVADVAASTATNYQLNAAGQSFTGNAAVAYSVTGGAGNDTFRVNGNWSTADKFDGAGGTADKFILGYDVAGAVDLNGTATTLANVEQFQSTVNQTGGAITLDAALTTVDLSAQTTALALTATGTTLTSLTTGASADTIDVVKVTAAGSTISLGAGADTITSLDLNGNTGAVSIDFGTGNATVGDIVAASHGAGVLTLKFGAALAGSTDTVTFTATSDNLKVGDILDFATDITSIKTTTNNANQAIITSGANTTVLFDINGNGSQDVGETLVVINGNNLTFGIVGFNLVVATSA